jgi:hypothetical protein
VNYLRSCPRPEAAAAITKLEQIDPDAVRRAATLAGLAALAAPAGGTTGGNASGSPAAADDATTDRDPGDTGGTLMPNEPGVPATAADLDLARRIAPVIGEDVDGVAAPGAGTPLPASAGSPGSPPAAGAAWRWALWAAAIVLVAFVSRSLLKPSAAAGPQR